MLDCMCVCMYARTRVLLLVYVCMYLCTHARVVGVCMAVRAATSPAAAASPIRGVRAPASSPIRAADVDALSTAFTAKAAIGAAKPLPTDATMSPAAYRAWLERTVPGSVCGDQHVCHIVASANGGADHPDNYVIANGKLNVQAGSRLDAYFAYHAGLEKTSAAVLISKRLRGYAGPSALELYREGEDMFRSYRVDARDARAAAAK